MFATLFLLPQAMFLSLTAPIFFPCRTTYAPSQSPASAFSSVDKTQAHILNSNTDML